MKKFFIILSGLYLLLFGLFLLGSGINSVFSSSSAGQVEPSPVIVWGVAILYSSLGLWASGSAIGLFLMKRWARKSSLIAAGIALFMGIALLLAARFILSSVLYNMGVTVESGIQILMIVNICSAIFGVIIPIWYLIFLNLKGVKAVFIPEDANSSKSETDLIT